MQEAGRLAADGLGAAFAKVLQHEPDTDTLLVRGGVGWRPGVIGVARLPPGATSPAGYAFATGRPSFSNDLAADHRFGMPPLLRDHGVRREVNVVIRGDGLPFGVLEVDDTEVGDFSEHDISFLEALANTLGLALERDRADAAREALLAEQGNLLAEVHHRVKNSLQLVYTVLNLQAQDAEDEVAARLLELSALRVLTIGAVHEQLYLSDQFDNVEMSQYLVGLVQALREGLAELGAAGRSVSLEASKGMNWPPKRAQAVGLVLTELVTNALKYGEGPVRIRFAADARKASLEVEDGGRGVPPDFDPKASTGLGMRIVQTLLREHGGVLRLAGSACFVADFPDLPAGP